MSAELLDHRAAPGVTKPAPRSLSQLLDAVAAGDGATVAVIIEPIATRSLGLILAFFPLLNLIPSPPGTTLVLGLPVVLVFVPLIGIWLTRRLSYKGAIDMPAVGAWQTEEQRVFIVFAQ